MTGASSGIGEAFAHELARSGFHLVLVARRGDVLARIAADLRRVHGIECQPVALDLAESTFMDSLLGRGEVTYVPGSRVRMMLALVPRRVLTRVLGRMTAEFARTTPQLLISGAVTRETKP